jgi:hypothetical protein
VPSRQSSAAPHAVPQAPQFRRSARVLTQLSPHWVNGPQSGSSPEASHPSETSARSAAESHASRRPCPALRDLRSDRREEREQRRHEPRPPAGRRRARSRDSAALGNERAVRLDARVRGRVAGIAHLALIGALAIAPAHGPAPGRPRARPVVFARALPADPVGRAARRRGARGARRVARARATNAVHAESAPALMGLIAAHTVGREG